MSTYNQQQYKNKAFILLALIIILLRVPIFCGYEPHVHPDTSDYELVAQQIKTLDFANYNGARTPGYPLLLLLCNMNHELVWLLQVVFGGAISLMLFDISYRHTRNIILSFLIGISNSLCLNLIFFEPSMVTETMSTFLIVTTIWLLTRSLYNCGNNQILYWVLIGTAIGFASITKPFLVILVPIYLAFVILKYSSIKMRHPQTILNKQLLAFVVPATVIILGWCSFNKLTVNYFGLTTLTGYNLTQHSGGFIELAPEEYSVIRDVYLKYRKETIEKIGTHSMTIWKAIPEMKTKTGLSYSELSKELTRMSLGLFIAHPIRYFQSVLTGAVNFWKVPIRWLPSQIRPSILRSCLENLWRMERIVLLLANLVFLVGGLMHLVSSLIRKKEKSHLISFIICIVLQGSLLQAVLEYGDNARYSIPFQPLILLVVLIVSYNALKRVYSSFV